MLKTMLFSGSSGSLSWVATLGSSSVDEGRSVAVAPDGSIYVCGRTVSAGAGDYDLLLAKFNSSGTVQWQKTLGGSKYDEGLSVAVAPDGSVYVCGYTKSAGAGYYDLLFAKFNSSGTVQWQKTFGGSDYDEGYSVAVAPDGSVYVCGRTGSAGAGGYDLLLAKFNSSGTVQWQKTLGGKSHDEGYSVAVAPDGSIYVCGRTVSAGAGDYDLLFAKFNSSGTVQWQKTFGSKNVEEGYSVTVAPDGSIYVCGRTSSAGAGSSDLLLAKFNSSGTVQWQKTLGSKYDEGLSVAVAPDGSIYVCGNTHSTGDVYPDLLLAKFNSSGTVQWQKTLGGSDYDEGYSVAVAPDGSVYVCGRTGSAGAGGYDLLLAKITDSLIGKDNITFGNITFKDVPLTLNNVSLTSQSSSLSVSNSNLTLNTASLTVGTPSLTVISTLYKE